MKVKFYGIYYKNDIIYKINLLDNNGKNDEKFEDKICIVN